MSRRSGERILEAELNEPLTVFDYAVEWVLAASLLFAPLAFGATEAWSQQVLYGLVAALAVLVGAKLMFVRGSKFIFSWTYVPIILYLLMVAISVIPLPAGVVQMISPGTVQEKTRLLADIPTVHELLSRLTISFNVWNTERSLRLVLAMSVVFVSIVNIYRTPIQIKRLLMTVAFAGAAVALLALAQDVTHAPGEPYKVYWTMDAVHPNSGPFAGHAQLGQYLNLAIGALLALALVLIGEAFNGEDPNRREIFDKFSSPQVRIAIVLGLLIIACVVAVAWSITRGAMIAMLVSGFVVAALLLYKRGWRGFESRVAVITLLGLAVVAGVGFVLAKPYIDKASEGAAASGYSRVTILKNMPPMFKTWPVMGSGLDTFEWVYPMFDKDEQTKSFFDHAEDDYAQTLTDTGIVGGVLTLLFVAIIFRRWLKAFLSRQPIQLATIGIAFGLLAVMIHSATDFSQRTPAVALESCVLLGLVVSLSRLAETAPAHESDVPSFGWSPMPGLAFSLLLLAPLGWSLWSLNGIRRAENVPPLESNIAAFSLDAKPTDADYTQKLHEYFADPITQDIEAARLDPKNVLYVRWLNHFRFRELAGIHNVKTTAVIYPPNAAQVGQQIVDELSAARVLCPCYGKLYTLLGKIQWDLFDKTAGEKNLQIGNQLRPGDGEPLYYLSQIAAERGQWDEAAKLGWQCYTIDFQYNLLLIDLFVRQYHHPEVAYASLKDSMWALGNLSLAIHDDPAQKPLLKQIQLRQLEIAKHDTETNPTGPTWAGLAGKLAEDGQLEESINAYRNALNDDYTNVTWRIALAHVLANIGRPAEAEKEAEICLRLSPQMDEAKGLIRSLPSTPTPAANQ